MMGLPEGRKSFKIGLAVLIQYWRVADRHPASHVAVAYRAYYVARVKILVVTVDNHLTWIVKS